MKDILEIWFWKLAIWVIKKDYGADCPTKDIDDFKEMDDHGKNCIFKSKTRCANCKAREIVEWIEDHIDLIESFK